MFPTIKNHCLQLTHGFDKIPDERKEILSQLSAYIKEQRQKNQALNLVYICTHNSRRSHLGQVWGAVAANFYGISGINTYSGGTEATAFNPNAIKALQTAGFEISQLTQGQNPRYLVSFGEDISTTCFSKVYDDKENPSDNFVAIMTCSHAEENCPYIPGVDLRIGITYDDPKDFDGTPQQDEKYLERSNQLALENLYVFSQIEA
jgi:protein-tyrosine phosphatase/arsenate reductase